MPTPTSPIPVNPEDTLKIKQPGTGLAAALPATDRLSVESTPLPPRPDPGYPRVRGYEILSIVGCGGMGIVYEARHRELNRRVAIKTLRGEALADPEFRNRFRAEAEAIARLQHPNIIQVFEIGTVEAFPFETHPSPFIALEFVDGGSLTPQTHAPQSPRLAARLVETLARAAHAAHLLGVIHRDLKPANVLLTRDGEPKIADFGIAKQIGAGSDQAMTRAGTVMGTPEYMAPEQLDGGEASPAIDIYALGVILYQLLTARVPFQGATFADTMMLALRQEPVPPRRLQPGVPRDLETICLKCLEKDPAKRYATAEALAVDLASWAEGRTIQARAAGPAERTVRWARRNPAVAVLSVAVCLVALTGLTGVFWGWNEARRNATAAEANAATAEANASAAKQAESDAREAEQKERWERYRVSVMAASSALRLYDSDAARRALEDAPEAHRDWVWHQLRAQLDRSRAILRTNANEIRHTRFTSDARWALTLYQDDRFRVWDTLNQKEYGPLDLGPDPRNAVLSEDGTTVGYGAPDHTVRLYDLASGRTRLILRGHTDAVGQVTFSPDGTRLYTTSLDRTLRTWDTKTGEQLHIFRAPARPDLSLHLSPNGRVVASRDGWRSPSVRVWDIETGRELAHLNGSKSYVHGIEFSPNGDRLATVDRFPETTVHIWDVATGQHIATLAGHENQVCHQLFSRDGKRLVTASMDRTVRVWDIPATPSQRPVEASLVLQGHSAWVHHAAFSPDGTRVISSSQDRTLRYWNAKTGELIAVLCGHTGPVLNSAFRKDATDIVSASSDGTLRLWDIAGAENGYAIRGHTNFVYSVAFFPDGNRIVSTAWDGTARVWNPTTGQELRRLDHGDEQYVVSVAVHSEGKYLVTLSRREGNAEMLIRLWDAHTNQLLHHWSVPTAWQDGRVAFAPRGDLFAAGARDGRVRLWDAGTRSEVALLDCGSTMPVRDVAFSPDGKWLAVGYDDGDCTIRIWDVSTRTCAHTLRGHKRCVYALAWNRTGTLLVSGSLDRSARLWDTATWTCIDELKQGGEVHGVAFTAKGRLLACACADNLIRVWDVGTRRELAELSGHRNYVHCLAFSPDGTRMVSASGDRTVRVWDTIPKAERTQK